MTARHEEPDTGRHDEMNPFSYGFADGGDLRGNDKYAHLKVKPEGPEDEARLAALEKMSGGEDLWLDVRSVMLYLQLGRTRVYDLIRSGVIPAVRIGRNIRVNKRVLDSLLEEWAVRD